MSINKVILVGNLGNDPDVKVIGESTVATFSLATNKRWKNKEGQPQERVEWHRVVAWRKVGELCGKYLKKGKQVYIEGELQTRDYDKDGVKHYITEILAQNVQFLGSAEGGRRDSPDPVPPEENISNEEAL